MIPWWAATALLGCNRYDLFRVAGYEQQSFNNKADVLFVIDNSDSMLPVSESMAVNFAKFIEDIDADEQARSYGGLADAVTNYADYVQDRSKFLDYRFSIVTTDAGRDAGEMVGPPVSRGEQDVPLRFVENLACEATCFSGASALPTDQGYQCGDPIGDFLSEEFMQCACGGASYTGNCGSANEEGLESAFLALCRAVDNPPVDCFEDFEVDDDGVVTEYTSLLDPTDAGSNEDMLRPDANVVIVVVSDEGDGSRRQLTEEIPERYVELFAKFKKRITWVHIGPGLTPDNEVACPGTATDWGVVRYNFLAYASDGRSIDVFDEQCDPRDFAEPLSQLGDVLTNLLTTFPLQSVPVPESLVVLVDGRGVDPATVVGEDQFGLDVYSDGWSYRAADNTVVFHGAAVPTYDVEVEVFYQPIDGMPRELPF